MRLVVGLFLLLIVAAGAALVALQFETRPPTVEIGGEITSIGRHPTLEFEASSGSQGLRRIAVQLRSDAAPETPILLHEETFPAVSWRGSGIQRQRVRVEPDLVERQVGEGPAQLEIEVDTYGWRLLPSAHAPAQTIPVVVDLTPPRLELLSAGHSLRLGGVDLLVFRQSEDTIESGVAVEDYFFPAKTGYFADAQAALAFFAVPQDLDTKARVRVAARDAAGNTREVRVPTIVRTRTFRERTLPISESFLQRVVPELEAENRLPPSTDLLAGYLEINRNLRQRNEETIRSVTGTSAPRPLWDGAFLRQARAATVSNFGDRRSYEYQGAIVDRQVHLGFDLASTKQAPVYATQTGRVVFAENLGIYGQTVILDHGLGIFSLYGHLSSIAVSVGDSVDRGAAIGRTGETGLAGGDHLHFSIMLHGIHVDPVEWWDERWLANQVQAKLDLLPAAEAQP